MSTFQRFRTCDACGGEGKTQQNKTIDLPQNQKVLVSLEPDICSKCGGTGKIDIVEDLRDELRSINKKTTKYFWSMIVLDSIGILVLIGLYYLVLEGLVKINDYNIVLLVILAILSYFSYAVLHDIRILSNKVPSLKEKVDLIEHIDAKAKHGETLDPIYIDGREVENISLIPPEDQTDALVDAIERELQIPEDFEWPSELPPLDESQRK